MNRACNIFSGCQLCIATVLLACVTGCEGGQQEISQPSYKYIIENGPRPPPARTGIGTAGVGHPLPNHPFPIDPLPVHPHPVRPIPVDRPMPSPLYRCPWLPGHMLY